MLFPALVYVFIREARSSHHDTASSDRPPAYLYVSCRPVYLMYPVQYVFHLRSYIKLAIKYELYPNCSRASMNSNVYFR